MPVSSPDSTSPQNVAFSPKVAKSANNCDGSTLYVTASPCIECAKLIIQAGIKRVVYADPYRNDDGIQLLRKVGIECVQLDVKCPECL